MKNYIIAILFTLPIGLYAQSLTGRVLDKNGEGLIGANVHWEGTSIGSTTDEEGKFEISQIAPGKRSLVVSYVGFRSDTLQIEDQLNIEVRLMDSQTLEEVKVTGRKAGTHISNINPIKTEVITQAELTKAACCDLAGCFNTQGSVEPNTTNLVTNAKELRILGLSGVYNQVLIDGMPLIQGLTYTYGISTVPGTAVDNIFVAKGANSVLQGFESISGQINVILKEPGDSEKFLFNAYVNSFLEKQFNVNYSTKVKKWNTLFAAHTTQPANKFDRDEDNFLDLPLLTRYSIFNKWMKGNEAEWGWHSMISFRYVNEERIGGQTDFNPDTDRGTMNSYGQTVQFSQPELYTKTGFRLDDRHHIVLLASAFQQDQESYFGTLRYDAQQVSAYANLQYELSYNESHSFKTGLSYRHMDRTEVLQFAPDSLNRTYGGKYIKQEQIPGVFAENVFNWKDRSITLITGLRADHHNDFGWHITPRALLRYNLTANTTARLSIGTGWRTINLFSENINLMASSRDVIITEELRPERALNYGANLTQKIYGRQVEAQVTLDFYRTQFMNQIFPDYDVDPTKAYISNFTGTSISNGLQAELGLEFFGRLGTKVAYNYLDVFRVIEGEKQVLPFNATHRVTGILSYQPLHQKWHADMNIHWYGEQRLPNTSANPPEYQRPDSSQPFTTVNLQVTKNWNKVELYAGCENIFDFRQERPIISWQQPFGAYFDTSSVWGPTRGREFYLGVRVRLEAKE